MAQRERMLTFASGGWVLALTGLILVALVAWALAPVVLGLAERPPGDGETPESYGFDLTAAPGVSLASLHAGHLHRDLLTALDDPDVIPGAQVLRYGADARGKYLVPTDRVIGVSVDGVARAYPITVLNNHEVVNDTLNDVPIVVTYNPLCDAVVVCDRRASDGVERRFGVSGLLLNSNLLLYDRLSGSAGADSLQSEPGTSVESLWSQLLARAVAGVAGAKGVTLTRLPAELVTWEDWFARHPDTTVLAPDLTMIKRYRETNYRGYFQSSTIAYPLDREPPEDGPAPKTRCVVVHAGTGPYVRSVADLVASATDGTVSELLGDSEFVFHVNDISDTVSVERADGQPAVVTYALWFAVHAFGF